MKQVWIIHGGNSFSSNSAFIDTLKDSTIDYERLKPKNHWSRWLASQLNSADILTPSFPNPQNAKYQEWKIYFEKLIPFFGDDVRLVGHSLGGMFLAKYLNEAPLPQKINQIVLVAAGYNDGSTEDLGSFEVTSAVNLHKSGKEIHLFHSKDDFIVPFAELAKFESDLPKATVHILDDSGHFLDSTFPELLEILKQD